MSEFKKGQIVACWDRDDCDKIVRIFVSKEGDYFRCCMAGEENCSVDRVFAWTEEWSYCVPLEEVEPGAFLARDREIIDGLRQELARERRTGEQAAEAVAMESELVQRLRRQIAWLCKELEECKGFVCPPKTQCVIQKPCRVCWEEASHKAVEDKTCPQ